MMLDRVRSFIVGFVAIASALVGAWSSQAQQTPADAAQSTSAGRISGRVVSSAGDPLVNAVVYLSTIGGLGPPRSATVNPDGSFKMEGLDVGTYAVWASAPGFVFDAPFTSLESRRLYHTGDSVNLTLTKGGVITGTVTNNSNAPVVAANVRAFRIRDEAGKPIDGSIQFRDRMTDDRGFYRIYGLQPGTYVVSAGGAGRFYGGFGTTLYDNDAPTYAPSSTRDTAAEVTVRTGDEVTVDIQYRGEPGHAISGIVAGLVQSQTAFSGGNVSLTDVKTRAMLTNTSASSFNNYGFAFYGLPDGEYELLAQQYSQSGDVRRSEPRRIKVQGADITGVNLTVAVLPSISGHIVLESDPPAACVRRRATAGQETVISARRQSRPAAKSSATKSTPTTVDSAPLIFMNQNADTVADAKGDFLLRNLYPGSYRMNVQLPSSGWYLRSILIGPNVRTADVSVAAEGISLKNQSVSGLIVTITEGAAGVRGRITASEGKPLPPNTRVYLVPAEKDSANNVLRFFEARVESDGSFAIGNIAPGQYWIIARQDDENETTTAKAIRQNPSLRTIVQREAQNLKKELTLKPCERLTDYELSYPPTTAMKP